MYAAKDTATCGRTLIRVTFERESPEADTPTIEVVFEFYLVGRLVDDTRVLLLLSSTRTDTRESVVLTEDERKAVFEKAAEFAVDLTTPT